MISPENLYNVYDRTVTTKQRLSALQFNTQLTLPQSHLFSRRQGLYTVQPMQVNIYDSEWTVGTLTGSYYRTHGYWSTGDSSATTVQDLLDDGEVVQRYAGSMRKVSQDSVTIHAAHDMYYNEGPTVSSYPLPVLSTVNQEYAQMDTNVPDAITMTSEFRTSIGARGLTTSISQNIYIPTQYFALYGDLGPFQTTTRDLASPSYYLSRPQPYTTTRVSDTATGTPTYKWCPVCRGEQAIDPLPDADLSNTSNPLYYCPTFAAYPYADEEV